MHHVCAQFRKRLFNCSRYQFSSGSWQYDEEFYQSLRGKSHFRTPWIAADPTIRIANRHRPYEFDCKTDSKVRVISLLGATGSGKTFIYHRLTRTTEPIQQLSDSLSPQTEGIELYLQQTESQDHVTAFLDVEGFQAADLPQNLLGRFAQQFSHFQFVEMLRNFGSDDFRSKRDKTCSEDIPRICYSLSDVFIMVAAGTPRTSIKTLQEQLTNIAAAMSHHLSFNSFKPALFLVFNQQTLSIVLDESNLTQTLLDALEPHCRQIISKAFSRIECFALSATIDPSFDSKLESFRSHLFTVLLDQENARGNQGISWNLDQWSEVAQRAVLDLSDGKDLSVVRHYYDILQQTTRQKMETYLRNMPAHFQKLFEKVSLKEVKNLREIAINRAAAGILLTWTANFQNLEAQIPDIDPPSLLQLLKSLENTSFCQFEKDGHRCISKGIHEVHSFPHGIKSSTQKVEMSNPFEHLTTDVHRRVKEMQETLKTIGESRSQFLSKLLNSEFRLSGHVSNPEQLDREICPLCLAKATGFLGCGHTFCSECLSESSSCPVCKQKSQWKSTDSALPPRGGYRILSMDGGGVRGLIPVLVLSHLENLTGIHPHYLFDCFAGTSTGGLVALTLGLTQRPLQDLKDLYTQPSRIFQNSVLRRSFGKTVGSLLERFIWGYPYDPEPLRQTIKTMIGGASFWQHHPRVIVTTCEILGGKYDPEPVLCGNLYHPKYKTIPWIDCINAGLATTAAPTYFPALIDHYRAFSDGGIRANNPSLLAFESCHSLWGKSNPLDVILSIGTGRPRIHGEETDPSYTLPWSLLKHLQGITDLLTESETVDRQLRERFLGSRLSSRYLRLNPLLSKNIPLDSTSETDVKTLQSVVQEQFVQNFELEPLSRRLMALCLVPEIHIDGDKIIFSVSCRLPRNANISLTKLNAFAQRIQMRVSSVRTLKSSSDVRIQQTGWESSILSFGTKHLTADKYTCDITVLHSLENRTVEKYPISGSPFEFTIFK